jgi:transposase
MPRLNNEQRVEIITLHQNGAKVSDLAEQFHVSRPTIYNLINKFQTTASVRDLQRPGRPRITDVRDDRRLVRLSSSNPQMVSRTLVSEWSGVQTSSRTVRRRLQRAGLCGHVATKKPSLKKHHRRARLQFAQAHLNWSVEQWKNVIWTDETPIYLTTAFQTRYIRTRGGLANRLTHTIPTLHSGGGHIMAWGAFFGRTKLPLRRISGSLTGQVYLNLLQEVNTMCPNHLTWMDDNAPAHRARSVNEWMTQQNRQRFVWPAQSPDLNPIENVWAELKRRLEGKRSQSLNELWDHSQQAWDSIDESFLENLVNSMPRRMAAVINARGGVTKY